MKTYCQVLALAFAMTSCVAQLCGWQSAMLFIGLAITTALLAISETER